MPTRRSKRKSELSDNLLKDMRLKNGDDNLARANRSIVYDKLTQELALVRLTENYVIHVIHSCSLKGKHGEVVTLLGIADKLVDGGGHCFNQFLGRTFEGCNDFVNALHTELLAVDILGLRQSVGIEE